MAHIAVTVGANGRFRAAPGNGSVTLHAPRRPHRASWCRATRPPGGCVCRPHCAPASLVLRAARRLRKAWRAVALVRCEQHRAPRDVDVVVIGAGQAGLSTAWALARQGFEPETGFVVLDGDDGPGGAWQHRWPSLTLGTTHRVHDLPGPALRAADDRPARRRRRARLLRRVRAPVRPARPPAGAGPAVRRTDDERFRVETDAGDWTARAIVNATGTWTRPFVPALPRPGDCSAAASCTPSTTAAPTSSPGSTSSSSAAGRRPRSCSARSPGSPTPPG